MNEWNEYEKWLVIETYTGDLMNIIYKWLTDMFYSW